MLSTQSMGTHIFTVTDTHTITTPSFTHPPLVSLLDRYMEGLNTHLAHTHMHYYYYFGDR